MRNLKRALSLALAFVMVMSLMIVGTSAKSYTDADKIDNQVAVEILGEIGVMVGNDDGSFAPDRDVTRAEMAVIITRILYGNNMNVDQFKNMNTFTDVPDWAEGFVNLCASLDIIAGRGNGIFDPDATVTSAEAALMLSRALGYFKNNAEFGNDWALAAMKRATQAGIIGGDMVLQANAGLDRDDGAQMTFNTLTKAVPVQYNEVLDVYYNENQGVIYALEFNYLQTLGYKNFSLVYKTNEQVEYGRPATVWGIGSYTVGGQTTASGIKKSDLTSEGGLLPNYVRMLDKDEIITVNNTPVYVYDNGTKEKDIYSDLGAAACNGVKDVKYDWTTFVNGEEVDSDVPAKNGSSNYQFTEKGAVTEIYVDDDTQDVTVVEINYYLGQVYSVKDGTTTIRSLSDGGKVLDDRTFATEEFAEDDYVVFTVDYNNDEEFYICEMMAPETMTGDVVRVEKETTDSTAYIRLDDEDSDKIYYTTDDHMVYDVSTGSTSHPTLNEEYILYMTPAGYILGFELANEKVPQYLYVTDSSEQLKDWTAKVILPDATEPKVDLDSDLDNTEDYAIADEIRWTHQNEFNENATNIDELIWDYSVNSDVYSLTYVPQLGEVDVDGKQVTVDSPLYQHHADGLRINNGKAYIEGQNEDTYFVVNDKTIFVDTMNNVAYTGYDEVPNVWDAELAYVVEDNVAQIVYILDGYVFDQNMTFFFITDEDDFESKEYKGDVYRVYESAYAETSKTKMYIAKDALNDREDALKEGVLYCATQSFEADNTRYITKVEVVATPDIWNVAGSGTGFISAPQYNGGTTFSVDTAAVFFHSDNSNLNKFTTNDDTTIVLVERNPVDPAEYKAAMAAGVNYSDPDDFKWTVTKGRVKDMAAKLDFDNGEIAVTVAKADNGVAELVYIYQIIPNLSADEFTVTFTGDRAGFAVNKVNADVSNVWGFEKNDDVNLTVAPQDNYEIASVTVTSGTADVTKNADGTYTVKIDDIAANVIINVTAFTAAGEVIVNADNTIDVTYLQGEAKPSVEQAIMAIQAKLDSMYNNERGITWSNPWGNVYRFVVTDVNGVDHTYTWNAFTGLYEVIPVTIDGENVNIPTGTTVNDLGLSALITVNGVEVPANTELKWGNKVVSGLAALQGNKGIVYGKPGTTITAEQAETAFEGTYVAKPGNVDNAPVEVADLQFPAAGVKDNYSGGATYEDGYFGVTVNGTLKIVAAGDTVGALATDNYYLVNDTDVKAKADVAAMKVNGDVTLTTVYKTTVNGIGSTGIALTASWEGDGVVYDKAGNAYVEKGTDATLTLTVADGFKTVASNLKLKVTNSSSAAVNPDKFGTPFNSHAGQIPSIDPGASVVTFPTAGVTYTAGSIVYTTINNVNSTGTVTLTVAWAA